MGQGVCIQTMQWGGGVCWVCVCRGDICPGGYCTGGVCLGMGVCLGVGVCQGVVYPGWHPAGGGVCQVVSTTPHPPANTPRDDHWSRQYTSYWNAFLWVPFVLFLSHWITIFTAWNHTHNERQFLETKSVIGRGWYGVASKSDLSMCMPTDWLRFQLISLAKAVRKFMRISIKYSDEPRCTVVDPGFPQGGGRQPSRGGTPT